MLKQYTRHKEGLELIAHAEHGLLVFIDASPSEQLDLKSDSKVCFVAVICNEDNTIDDLYQFKVGSWKQKLKRAEMLVNAIKNDDISILAYGLSARQKTLLPWAIETLNQALQKIGASWTDDAEKLHWNSNVYPRTQAFGLGAYSSVLTIFGLTVAHWTKNAGLSKATMILDDLPCGSAKAMPLLMELSYNAESFKGWEENIALDDASFTITNMESYTTPEGETCAAKEHPHFIIADWLAASLRARHDPASFVGKNNRSRPEHEVALIAEVWSALEKKGSATERDLDDPDLQASIAKFQAGVGPT